MRGNLLRQHFGKNEVRERTYFEFKQTLVVTHMMAIVPQLEPVAKAIKMEIVNVRVGSRRKSRAGFVSISEKKRSV